MRNTKAKAMVDIDNNDLLPYKVGGLLYAPANKKGLLNKIISHSIPGLKSLALCLEDAVNVRALPQAEQMMVETVDALNKASWSSLDCCPLLFVRIRNTEHLKHISDLLDQKELHVTGFIFPKFDVSNAEQYMEILKDLQPTSGPTIYGMPILESRLVANLGNRVAMLEEVKYIIDSQKELVLNIRVGGNDLCNLFGLRRNVNESIYEIGVVRDVLVNILNIFAQEYVISGPVWEYFGSAGDDEAWKIGLKKELRLDILNGFIGKTAIHPCQLPVINEALAVSQEDYQDACAIYQWNEASREDAVRKSVSGNRMSEFKTHRSWAKRILCLAKVYGLRNGRL